MLEERSGKLNGSSLLADEATLVIFPRMPLGTLGRRENLNSHQNDAVCIPVVVASSLRRPTTERLMNKKFAKKFFCSAVPARWSSLR